MKTIKFILFTSLILLILIFIKIRHDSYLIFKEKLVAQIDLIEFVLRGTNVDPTYFDNTSKNGVGFINWIETQLQINEKDIAEIGIDKIDVLFDKKTNKGYVIFCKGLNSNKLSKLPFNTIYKENVYILKDNFFLEYLFSYNFCIVVATMKNNSAPKHNPSCAK